ncbi:MAG: hypothetical protein A3C53_00550 [Omnitrophica WOR_2 bacterium RIFCSPHIGHO2_02_FULL_68_15]|nr:MAG: hypothetical protein A3C53_00550 [Omnitrophica WOR_2 bacterium RIFCSPHIGHO2_02_FULL_68_15]
MSLNGLPTMLERLERHPGARRVQELIKPSAARPIWWTLEHPLPQRLDYHRACRTCRFVRTPARRRVCQRRFLKAVARACAAKAPETFQCPIDRPAAVIPILQDQQVTGHVAVCHLDQALPGPSVPLASVALNTAVRELERERELTNLYESIQPRCVALSTIHTIHRLISSTMNLEELVPRLARLCVQVVRARRCAIWFVDDDRRRLTPAAVVDLRTRKAVESSLRMGQGIPGRVAATAQPYRNNQLLVVPLMDEDMLGVIAVRDKQDGQPFTAFDQETLTTMAEQAVVAIGNARLYAQQEKVALGTIKSLAAILDTMDGNTPHGRSHTRLLADVALALADALGVKPEDRRSLQYAALLHDAGRVAVPDEILLKPTTLTGQERRIVQRHHVKGVELMRPLEILEPAIPIILHHHERYDGRGYPKGLRGDDIPWGARIMAVANAFEAMICDRPYREALSLDQAAREIQHNAGTQFDPRVVEAFHQLVRQGRLRRLLARDVSAAR